MKGKKMSSYNWRDRRLTWLGAAMAVDSARGEDLPQEGLFRVPERVREDAMQLLKELRASKWPAPHKIVPTPSGGLVVEYTEPITLTELEVDPENPRSVTIRHYLKIPKPFSFPLMLTGFKTHNQTPHKLIYSRTTVLAVKFS